MTNIRTARAVYQVESVAPGVIIARHKATNGKRRYLTLADVGRARWEAAIADYWASQHRAEAP